MDKSPGGATWALLNMCDARSIHALMCSRLLGINVAEVQAFCLEAAGVQVFRSGLDTPPTLPPGRPRTWLEVMTMQEVEGTWNCILVEESEAQICESVGSAVALGRNLFRVRGLRDISIYILRPRCIATTPHACIHLDYPLHLEGPQHSLASLGGCLRVHLAEGMHARIKNIILEGCTTEIGGLLSACKVVEGRLFVSYCLFQAHSCGLYVGASARRGLLTRGARAVISRSCMRAFSDDVGMAVGCLACCGGALEIYDSVFDHCTTKIEVWDTGSVVLLQKEYAGAVRTHRGGSFRIVDPHSHSDPLPLTPRRLAQPA